MLCRSCLILFGLALSACQGDKGDSAPDTRDSGGDTAQDTALEPVPTGEAALLPWLEAGQYLDWPAEAAIHASTGPHFGRVRTFLREDLADSLAAGAAQHPVESAAVKELYGEDGDTIRGYSVMVRTSDQADGDGWYWLERYDGRTYADGEGVGGCTGCHSAGVDFILTPWPQ